MDDTREHRKLPIIFGLRLRLTVVIFTIGALLSTVITFTSYRITEANLVKQLRDRVGDLARVGALSVDRAALGELAIQIDPQISPTRSGSIEASAPYSLISGELATIRSTDSRLIRSVELLVPAKASDHAWYLAGAPAIAGQNRSFSSPVDLSAAPAAQAVITGHRTQVDAQFAPEPGLHAASVTAYAPVMEGKRLVALLGVSVLDSTVRAALTSSTRTSVLVGLAALLVALLASVAFGGLISGGILELDRVVRRFSERDLTVRAKIGSRDEIGRLGKSFNNMADILERSSSQLENLLSAYGRFVPHDFLRFLEKESVLEVKLGDQVQRDMTVLFSDIRGFTELSEAMSPRENFNFINSYLSRMGPEIRAHHGFIDKYIGDAIMALFPDQPNDAVQAAIAMQERLREYNRHRASVGYRAVDIGIGIHTGSLMLGTIGEEQRMDGSVIADAVNLCSRLEALTRVYGGTVLISGQTLASLDQQRSHRFRFVDRVRVRGRSETVLIYELFDGDDEEQRILKSVTREDWNRAVDRYYAREFDEAYEILRSIHEQNARDRVVELYMQRCAGLLERGLPEDWEGVETIDLK